MNRERRSKIAPHPLLLRVPNDGRPDPPSPRPSRGAVRQLRDQRLLLLAHARQRVKLRAQPVELRASFASKRPRLGARASPTRRLQGRSIRANVGVELKGVRCGVERRRGRGLKAGGVAERCAGAKSLRNGVHHANAVVRGPVYRTHLRRRLVPLPHRAQFLALGARRLRRGGGLRRRETKRARRQRGEHGMEGGKKEEDGRTRDRGREDEDVSVLNDSDGERRSIDDAPARPRRRRRSSRCRSAA